MDGRLVAEHARGWARHRTLTDPDHADAATAMRRQYRLSGAVAAAVERREAMATRTTTSRDIAEELAFLSRALKAPALLEATDRPAERAELPASRASGWLAATEQGVAGGEACPVQQWIAPFLLPLVLPVRRVRCSMSGYQAFGHMQCSCAAS